MQPPFPSPTSTWHKGTYAAIDPSNPELCQAGKTVIITGAGSGIGRATALAFAKAGATRLILTGRTGATLRETEKLLTNIDCSVFPASVTDESDMREISKQIGAWDILVLNVPSRPSAIAQASQQDWWADYDTNVRSVLVASQAFLPTAKPGSAFYTFTSGACVLPPALAPSDSSYRSTKFAQTKVVEYLAKINPDIFFCSVHLGLVEIDLLRKSGADLTQLPTNTVDLLAHFLVWLSQPKTRFLNGKMVWANWDVGELETWAGEIQSSPSQTINTR